MGLKLKEFIAFEWLMFLIFGVFWAAAMCLPLFLTGFLQQKTEFWRNFFIMWGPYVTYLIIRSSVLLVRSVVWAYLVSNFLFTSEREKKLAQEWILFVLLVLLWSLIMAYPLYLTGMFSGMEKIMVSIFLLLAPYLGHLLLNVGKNFLKSIGWAMRVTIKA